jgi:hypothetical protein
MTVREIQGFLAEMYAVEVSPDLISTVTDGIGAEVTLEPATLGLEGGDRVLVETCSRCSPAIDQC